MDDLAEVWPELFMFLVFLCCDVCSIGFVISSILERGFLIKHPVLKNQYSESFTAEKTTTLSAIASKHKRNRNSLYNN